MSTLALLLALVGQFTPPTEAPAEPPEVIDPLVAKLLHLDARDEAFREILARQVYRGPGRYYEIPNRPGSQKVNHVIVCPQREGPPIFAVTLGGSSGESTHRPTGYLTLIDSDGAIIRVYRGNNLIGTDGQIADVNRDGVMDFVYAIDHVHRPLGADFATTPGVGATVLEVAPITREPEPILRVAFNRFPSSSIYKTRSMTWRMRSRGVDPVDFEIGITVPLSGEFQPLVSYRWYPEIKAYTGPDGREQESYKRLEGTTDDDLWKFVGVDPAEIEAQIEAYRRPWMVAESPAPMAEATFDEGSARLINRGMLVTEREYLRGSRLSFLWWWRSDDPETNPDQLAICLRTDGRLQTDRAHEIEEGLVVRLNPAGGGKILLERWEDGEGEVLAEAAFPMEPSMAYPIRVEDRGTSILVRHEFEKVLEHPVDREAGGTSRKVAIYNRESVAGVKMVSELRSLGVYESPTPVPPATSP